MNTLQFSLFFAALFVGYVLVHLRLVRFETYLREIAGLKLLNERFKGVSDVLSRVSLDPIEDRLDLVYAELRSLTETAARLERAARHRAEPAEPAVVEPVGSPPTAAERIRALVETRLFSLGYRNLHILTDLSGVAFEDEVAVTVECEKKQMAQKGKVVVCNGAVRDVSLQSVAQAFP